MKQQFQHTSANEKGLASIVKFFIAVIVIAGVVYSEIMFLGIISVIFPDGIMRLGAIIGALTTGASVLTLCIGKSHTFRPGIQMYSAWAFTALEIAVLIMNDILAYAMHNGNVDSWLQVWKQFCPASPVLSVVGWVVIVFLNPERVLRHAHMEMNDEIALSEIEYQRALHRAEMEARYGAMTDLSAHLRTIIKEESQPALIEGARRAGSEIVSALTKTPLVGFTQARKLESPKVVESNPPTPALAASGDRIVDKYEVKPEVDAEKKKMDKPKSFGQMLGDVHAAFHGAIDKRLDGSRDESRETPVEQPPHSETTTVFVPARDDKPITEEKPGHDPRTRRLGGNEQFEQEEGDVNP